MPHTHDTTTHDTNSNATWATRHELATRYKVHPRTIDDWRKAGNLPAFVYGRRIVRFDIKACDEWIGKLRHSARWEHSKGGKAL
jgi:hypothetical protein